MKLALRQDGSHVRTLHTARDCLRRVAGPSVSPTPPEAEQLNGVHVRSYCPFGPVSACSAVAAAAELGIIELSSAERKC